MTTAHEPATARHAPRKVAIVGGGPTRLLAPFDDPTWEIWAFSSRRWQPPRVTRWFELHALTDLRQQLASYKRGRRTFPEYMRFLRSLSCPVYMQRRHPSIPHSVVFPLAKVLRQFGRCFTSTASYLVALAMAEGAQVIGLWGVNPRCGFEPSHEDYGRQRPALEYLLGVARQRGIQVVLPEGTSLRVPQRPRFVRTPVLYAYDWRSPHAWWRERVRRQWRLRRRRSAADALGGPMGSGGVTAAGTAVEAARTGVEITAGNTDAATGAARTARAAGVRSSGAMGLPPGRTAGMRPGRSGRLTASGARRLAGVRSKQAVGGLTGRIATARAMRAVGVPRARTIRAHRARVVDVRSGRSAGW